MLYSYAAPSGAVTTMVPVVTAQVGCIVTLAVGDAGTAGTGLIVTVPAAKVMQVLSAVLLTESVYVAGASPEKVALAW
jgi:hypothetical protein